MPAWTYPLATQQPDPWPSAWTRPVAGLLLVLYMLVGAAFALGTPSWQVPDEPAHVNYARHVAATGTLPVLQPGDYDAAYLEAIKAARFPPTMSVTSIRYEAHQPPLYYLLAAGLLRILTPDALAPEPPWAALVRAMRVMRFLSLVLSAGTLWVVYRLGRDLFPAHPSWALAATAFVAFIPQHVAMMAGANNDALAELVLALWLWALVRLLLEPTPVRWGRLGLLLGIALLTKTTLYLPVALSGMTAFFLRGLTVDTSPARRRCLARDAALTLGIGLMLALPFYLRNLWVYGWPDVLSWRRHAAVVVGQMTTAAFVEQHGWAAYWRRAFTWTFRSFWGQFGWMGVLLDARVYRALAYVSGLLGLAALLFVRAGWRDRHVNALRGRATVYRTLAPEQHNALAVLLAAALGTVIAYVGYNVTFLQHQGRYLFLALAPLAYLVVPGVWLLLAPHVARRLAAGCLAAAAVALAAALADLDGFTRWDALTLLALALWLGVAARWPRWRPLWLLLPFWLLAPFSLWTLVRFLIPALTTAVQV